MAIDELVDRLNRVITTTPDGALSHVSRPIIDQLCEEYLRSSPELRVNTSRLVARATRNTLLQYAWFAAEEAVRNRSTDLVVRGLTALIVEDGRMDIRDTIMRLAVLLHSASLLSMDVNRVFSDIASLSHNAVLADQVRGFPTSPRRLELHRFYIQAVGTGKGFRYESYDLPRKRWWQFWSRT